MMGGNKYNEKLSLLKELIKLAKSDSTIRDEEYEFLIAISKQLGVSDEDFENLFDQYIEFIPPKHELDRIVQFQRLVLMINVDQYISDEELDQIKNMGIRLGLHPGATDEVLNVMHDYEHGVVPPEHLIRIFKTYHN